MLSLTPLSAIGHCPVSRSIHLQFVPKPFGFPAFSDGFGLRSLEPLGGGISPKSRVIARTGTLSSSSHETDIIWRSLQPVGLSPGITWESNSHLSASGQSRNVRGSQSIPSQIVGPKSSGPEKVEGNLGVYFANSPGKIRDSDSLN